MPGTKYQTLGQRTFLTIFIFCLKDAMVTSVLHVIKFFQQLRWILMKETSLSSFIKITLGVLEMSIKKSLLTVAHSLDTRHGLTAE